MPVVWQISAVEFPEITHISGVILDSDVSGGHGKRGILKNIAGVIRSYSLKTYNNREIIIQYGGKRISAGTDAYGGFSIEVREGRAEEVQVFLPGDQNPLKIIQDYPVIIRDTDSALAIISDIDDTILVSHTASLFKRLSTLFLVTPQNRKSIDFTYRLLKTVNEKRGRVFYVSKSESNLFEILTSFIRKNGLPEGKLFLTPYLNFRRLVRPKKGKDFKEEAMRFIIDRSPGKKFILLGDDTQRDMEIYTYIAKRYPEQIIRIYIRKTRKNLLGKKMEHLNNMNGLPLPTFYFSDDDDVSGETETIKNYR